MLTRNSWFNSPMFDDFLDIGGMLKDMNKNLLFDSKVNDDKSLSISVDIPGIDENDINIEVIENVVRISGQRKTKTSSYSVNKSFNVQEGYDLDNAKAELKNGVLTLTFAAKALPESKAKKIKVLTGNVSAEKESNENK